MSQNFLLRGFDYLEKNISPGKNSILPGTVHTKEVLKHIMVLHPVHFERIFRNYSLTKGVKEMKETPKLIIPTLHQKFYILIETKKVNSVERINLISAIFPIGKKKRGMEKFFSLLKTKQANKLIFMVKENKIPHFFKEILVKNIKISLFDFFTILFKVLRSERKPGISAPKGKIDVKSVFFEGVSPFEPFFSDFIEK